MASTRKSGSGRRRARVRSVRGVLGEAWRDIKAGAAIFVPGSPTQSTGATNARKPARAKAERKANGPSTTTSKKRAVKTATKRLVTKGAKQAAAVKRSVGKRLTAKSGRSPGTAAPRKSTPQPVKQTARQPAKRRPGARTRQRGARPDSRGLYPGLAREVAHTAVSIGFILLGAGFYVVFQIIAPDPPAGEDLWAVNRLPSIIILDADGKEVASRGARYGEAVAVGELPPYLIKAFLSTEDRRFYDHHGVDLRGIARALITNLRSGEIEEGGSTITQQLAKNLFLTPEQSYIRKAREALLAIWLEGRYTKDEILSLYLNRIYMGAGAYGVESAAQTYFNKSARDVSLGEAVMLAGLPKAPSALAPTQNPFGAQDRANEVLENLRETGQITELEARAARLDPPVIQPGDADGEIGYFFDYIAEEVRAKLGDTARDARDIIVRTTLDLKAQRAAEGAVKSVLNTENKLAGATQAGLIAYDNETGAIIAMVGGRKYVESQFNRTIQARRQPGSAFKPFVYAAAYENGFRPSSRFVDQPIDIAGWRPSNYSNTHLGPVRLTEAMAKSINTVAVQVSETVGREKVIALAHRLGVKSDIPEKEAGIALGAFNATLAELTAAYLPFARGGLSIEPFAILRIENGAGAVLYEHAPEAPERVISANTAKDMTHTLYQVMTTGTGRRASLGRRAAAGKTGTTNDWRDAWFIGYTAQITAGVWVGNDEYQPMQKVTGGALPAQIWKDFMLVAHQGLDNEGLPGAVAAPTYADENELLGFYASVAEGLARVKRDGRSYR